MSARWDRQGTDRRNPDRVLDELACYFAWHERTREVNGELAPRLADLDPADWYIKADFAIPPALVPFTLFGPTGLFLLMGTRGYWTAEHVGAMRAAADTLTGIMGYPDPANAAIVILDDSRDPRQEYTGGGRGPCWVLGERWLIEWLESGFEGHGFSAADVKRLRQSANPDAVVEPNRNFMPRGTGHDGRLPQDWYFPG